MKDERKRLVDLPCFVNTLDIDLLPPFPRSRRASGRRVTGSRLGFAGREILSMEVPTASTTTVLPITETESQEEKMNKARMRRLKNFHQQVRLLRDQISGMTEKIEEAVTTVGVILEEERESYKRLPESLKYTESAETSMKYIDLLGDIESYVEGVSIWIHDAVDMLDTIDLNLEEREGMQA